MNREIPPSLARFEGELERAIGRALKRAPSPRRLWRARPRVLAGTTIGITAIAIALAVALTAASSSPAFAVTRNHDGTVSVKILRASGLGPANAKLAAMRIHARVLQVAVHCASKFPPPPPQRAPFHPWQMLIRPAEIPRGRTLVLGLGKAGREVRLPNVRAVLPPPKIRAVIPPPNVRAVLVPAPPGAIRGCIPPPPPCAWWVRHRKNVRMPVPSVPGDRKGLVRQAPLPGCAVRPTPTPVPGQ